MSLLEEQTCYLYYCDWSYCVVFLFELHHLKCPLSVKRWECQGFRITVDIIFLGNVIGWQSDKQLTVKQMSLSCRVSADRIFF